MHFSSPGWQENQDTWWREGGEGSTAPDASKMFSSRTGGASSNLRSASLAPSSANRHSFRKSDKNDSFSIVFENDDEDEEDASDVVVFEESKSRQLQCSSKSKVTNWHVKWSIRAKESSCPREIVQTSEKS